MMGPPPVPVRREILLLGGGHANVQVLKMLRMRRPPDVRVTMVNDGPTAVYSGMLPGCIAGLYEPDEIRMDLVKLARACGARLVLARAEGVDLARKEVLLEGRPPLGYDLLAINVGSTVRGLDVPGVLEHAIPTRPIGRFPTRIDAALARAPREVRIAVVGGGAAGVELAFGLEARCRRNGGKGRLTLFERGNEVLTGGSPRARALARKLLVERGIEVRTGADVERVEAGTLHLSGGTRAGFDLLVWATGGAAPPLLEKTGLYRDEQGFLRVSPTLETSDPAVFAAGDCVAIEGHPPLPKAGVYAVREGPVLAANLLARLEGRLPRPYRPQKGFLSLLSTGDGEAIADWKGFALHGPRIWKWKDRIDRRWMRKFLPEEIDPDITDPKEEMRCAGCGAKAAAEVLASELGRIDGADDPGVTIGLDAREDAAAIEVAPGAIELQTIDYFPAFIEDPYLLGRIAAVHAASDLHAMGASPRTAMVLAVLPYAEDAVAARDLRQLMAGIALESSREGMAIVGGHTSEGERLAVGLAVTGRAGEGPLLRKSGLAPGDRLVLTKSLGTGTILAAEMRGRAKGDWMEGACAMMLQSNGPAAAVLLRHGVRAATDVTGFGLAGHTIEMIEASGVGARLDPAAVPALPGARECLAAEIRSSLDPANRSRAAGIGFTPDPGSDTDLLFDPQTSGGLLAGVPADRADALLAALHAAGYEHAAVIGEVLEGNPRIETD